MKKIAVITAAAAVSLLVLSGCTQRATPYVDKETAGPTAVPTETVSPSAVPTANALMTIPMKDSDGYTANLVITRWTPETAGVPSCPTFADNYQGYAYKSSDIAGYVDFPTVNGFVWKNPFTMQILSGDREATDMDERLAVGGVCSKAITTHGWANFGATLYFYPPFETKTPFSASVSYAAKITPNTPAGDFSQVAGYFPALLVYNVNGGCDSISTSTFKASNSGSGSASACVITRQ